MGTKGVLVLQAGKISNLKNHSGGLVLLGRVEGYVGSAGSCLQPQATKQGGYCFGDVEVTCSLPPHLQWALHPT